MNAKYTPGPWVITGQETERYTSTIRHIDETPGQRKELWIADCTKHDAGLIAAAPDLLEACKDAFLLAHPCPECGQVELLGEGLAKCPCADRPWDWRDVAPIKDGWQACRDAIAKAEGQS